MKCIMHCHTMQMIEITKQNKEAKIQEILGCRFVGTLYHMHDRLGLKEKHNQNVHTILPPCLASSTYYIERSTQPLLLPLLLSPCLAIIVTLDFVSVCHVEWNTHLPLLSMPLPPCSAPPLLVT